jgi:cytochrome b561
MLKNTENTYGSLHRAFHWIMAIMIIGMICVGVYIHGLDAENAAEAPIKSSLGALHKATGMVILLLVVLRTAWVFMGPRPGLPDSVPRWQRIAAKSLHHGFYLLMFAIPVSGYVMSSHAQKPVNMYGLFELPMLFDEQNFDKAKAVFEVHETLAMILLILIVVHVLIALKHHFVDKDNILRRMLKGE